MSRFAWCATCGAGFMPDRPQQRFCSRSCGTSGGPVAERFWTKVECQPDGCWRWIGRIMGRGYGATTTPTYMHPDRPGRRHVYAHRLAYELTVGPIPEGLTLDHLCRNRACVNPAHLEPVTSRENTRRGMIATADACVNGHPWDEANTYRRRDDGSRKCRACARERERLYRIGRQAAA